MIGSFDTLAKPAKPWNRRLLLIAVAAMLNSGCTSLQVPQFTLPPLPFSAPPTPTYPGAASGFELQPERAEQIYNGVREAKARNAVVLQIVGDSAPVRVLPLPADGRSVTVSNLLTQTQVPKKLGSIDATLFRSAEGSIGGLPLEVKMALDGKSVRPETDYALRPGDRLRVHKAASPAAQGLLESILGL